jgi:ankyrin repeat/SOCS box protein 13/metal transporter CNNM
MFQFILAVLLAVLVLAAVTLKKAYYFLPAKELKRQADFGEMPATLFWRAVAYGSSLRLFLWLVIGMASATCFVLLGQVAPPVLALLAVGFFLLVAFAWLPGSRLTGITVRIAEMLTPPTAWLVRTLDPVLRTISARLDHRKPNHLHTGVYIRQDLLELIERQKDQHDNHLTIEELDLAARALQFGELKVRKVMTGRKKIHAVDASDAISPVFLDELHKHGNVLFPVFEGKPDNIVGTLDLGDLTDISKGKGAKGTVRTHMKRGVVYVHESDSLADALHAYYQTKRTAFVVVNKFEEYVGILTLDDILHQLIGATGEYGFDQHEDITAVAVKHNKKPKPVEETIEEPATETPDISTSPEEVIE